MERVILGDWSIPLKFVWTWLMISQVQEQLSHNRFCKNVARLAIARERNYVWQPCDAP